MNESFGKSGTTFSLFSRFPVDSKRWSPSKLSLGTQVRSWWNSLWLVGEPLWATGWWSPLLLLVLRGFSKDIASPSCFCARDAFVQRCWWWNTGKGHGFKTSQCCNSCQGNQVKLLSARWGTHFVIIWPWHCLNGCGELGGTHQLISHLPKHCF